MSKSPGARIAVMIVQAAEDFKPQREWDVPSNIVGGRLFKKNLTSTVAKHFARVFNAHQCGACACKQWNREWAIVVPCLKRKWRDRFGQQTAAKGGGNDE
jgi:hypothetical protein